MIITPAFYVPINCLIVILVLMLTPVKPVNLKIILDPLLMLKENAFV